MAKKDNKRGLGKGLGALIPAATEDFIMEHNEIVTAESFINEHKDALTSIAIKNIAPSREQPRMIFDDTKMEELSTSIKNHGVLQPLVVREKKKGQFELIAGERRLRGAKLAGLKEVPVVIIEANDALVAELGLIENLQREDLSPLEEGEAFSHMITTFDYTQEALATTLGKSRSYVANSLRLLTLSEREKAHLAAGEMTPGHARALMAVKTADGRSFLLDEIIAKSLSVRQTEDLAKRINEAGAKEEPPQQKVRKQSLSPLQREMENRLRQQLQTKVKIKNTNYGGCIEIDYYNDEDLLRILSRVIEEEASLIKSND